MKKVNPVLVSNRFESCEISRSEAARLLRAHRAIQCSFSNNADVRFMLRKSRVNDVLGENHGSYQMGCSSLHTFHKAELTEGFARQGLISCSLHLFRNPDYWMNIVNVAIGRRVSPILFAAWNDWLSWNPQFAPAIEEFLKKQAAIYQIGDEYLKNHPAPRRRHLQERQPHAA